MQSIHCKASLDDQHRRFLFKFSPLSSESGVSAQWSQFNQFQNLVRSLYGLGGDNFVLKYKDDEGDHILIECDEELNCAVAQSAGLLRLFIKLKDEQLVDVTTTTTTSTTTTPTTKTTTTVVSTVSTLPSENTCPYRARYGHHGRGGRHGQGNGHWHGHHGHEHAHDHCHGHGKHSGQFTTEKLTSKREYLASLLNDPQLNNDEFSKLKLQRKLECIDRLVTNNQQEGSKYESSSSSGDEKWRKKKCDKYRKKYEKNGKKPSKIRRNLTEDEKVMMKVLKTQIWELKPTLNSVKIQLGEKKALKADAKNKGDTQRVEELKKEIKQLKEIKKEHYKAVAPLKDQIRALKFENRQEC